MKWIGLTGGIASGKSTVTKLLRTLGYQVLDADEVSHQVTAVGGTALPRIFQTFGESVQNTDGSLNRPALAKLVFGRADELRKLEEIIHPLVRDEVLQQRTRLSQSGETVVFYDVPLLYEKQMEKDFDAVILVSTSEDLQKKRLMQRNFLSSEEAEKRIQSQISLREKERKTKFVVHNTGDVIFLENEVKRVLKDLKL
jgi:dephospho-CoA kinase